MMAKIFIKIKNIAALFILLSVLIGCGYSDIHDTVDAFTNYKKEYTVSFESNGGSYVPSQTVNSGKTAARPADPAKSGCTFDGWHSNQELTMVYDFSTPVIGNITLYAKWNGSPITYTVSFDSNDGSYIAPLTVISGGIAPRPTDPIKSGYTLAYWCSDSGLTTKYDFSTPVTEDITLYALWKILDPTTFNVTFESNGGSYIETQNVKSGGTATRPTDPTKSGYNFVNWYSNSGLTTVYNFSTAVNKDIKLYAKWNVITFTVTFESNGGSSVPKQTVKSGDTANRPADPTRSGYIFDNWYTILGSVYDFSTPVIGNITLSAKWNQGYTIVNIAAIQGVTPPAAGGIPVTVITANDQYTGIVKWNPNHAKFAVSTEYTATITLTAKSGYTLQGVTANFFTVDVATSVSNSANSGVVTAEFPPAGWNVNNQSTWNEAVNSIKNGGNNKNYNINVIGDFSIPGVTDNTFGNVTGITVTIAGNKRISLSTNSNGSLLHIGANQTVIIRDIGLSGHYFGNIAPLVHVTGANSSFTMQGSATVSGNSSSSYGGGVVVGEFILSDDGEVLFADSGTFTMQGNATVSGNNSSSYGGGVFVANGIFTMQHNATVSDNNSSDGGGGVCINGGYEFTDFTMQDNATVSNNTTSGDGGGVAIGWAAFTMQNNATVSGNTAHDGGGVYVSFYGRFTLAGGTVYGAVGRPMGNTCSSTGAALYVERNIIDSGGIAEYGDGSNILLQKDSRALYTNDTIHR